MSKNDFAHTDNLFDRSTVMLFAKKNYPFGDYQDNEAAKTTAFRKT
jgi:hypothetical protein